ncbi:hypothetical protein HG66A1_53040 [Gimesia chilikensis]|jgi:hypothetical protein|uniref:Uncharacterized protein n=1 Tax=Gimesia chilikensis TaxID=2605989 RepID=A0A517PVT5_9PLAN|nr:hypothetical protein HG66A1_53040 [Gimesia chilikensis]
MAIKSREHFRLHSLLVITFLLYNFLGLARQLRSQL